MNLASTTQKVIGLVEEKTGVPVVVTPDTSLQMLAAVKIARHSAPAHIITYNPLMGAGVDYAVCFQCGFVLRAFLAQEPDRFDFGSSWRGRKDVEKLLAEHLRGKRLPLPKDVRSQLKDQLFDGLMVQLRSVPVGLRVDTWIGHECPDLLDQQRIVITRQMKDNLKSLGPDVQQISPGKVFSASVAMNAAFASFWSKAWNDPLATAPYRETGHLSAGEALLQLWYDVPEDCSNDKRLIDAWGQSLGLQGWYEFLPFAGASRKT
jgi:hypothetical protein